MNDYSQFNRSSRLLLAAGLASILLGVTLFLPMPPRVHASSTTVDTLTDDNITNGNCTLREAIIAANTDATVDGCLGAPALDTINFAPSVSGTIVLSSTLGTLPIISQDLTINGPGASLLTISGNNAVRVMHVNGGVKFFLSGVTIANGNSGSGGGGMINFGTMNITGTNFYNNRTSSLDGGALYNVAGTVNITNSTLYSNSTSGNGGSIYSNGTIINLTNSNIYSNTAASTGGGIYQSGGALFVSNSGIYSNTASSDGGGVYLNSSVLSLGNSNVYSNTAFNANGGGLYNNNGGLFITSSTITNNVAVSNTNSNGFGGGIYNYGFLLVGNSKLSNNRAGTLGGAIFVITSTATVTTTTFSGNHAYGTFGGGGILSWFNTALNLDRSSLYSNDSSSGGGAIGNLGIMTITSSSIYTNTAYGAGGIYNLGSLTITNSTIANNRAVGSDGGGIYNAAFFVNYVAMITLTNSTIAGNSAVANGGGIFNETNVTVTLANTIVANNSATTGGNCYGTIMDGGKNLQWSPSVGCGFALAAGDPKLAPLGNYGGATKTMALFLGSAAIDTGMDAGCPALDQRGVTRWQGTHCDIGAFEGFLYPLYLPLIKR